MQIVKFLLYFVVLLSSGICYGYLQLAVHPDMYRRPLWSFGDDRGIYNAKFMFTVLSINTLMFIPTLIWGVMNWSIFWAIITSLICGFIGRLIEITLEDVNKLNLIMIPFYTTSVLCILLWVL